MKRVIFYRCHSAERSKRKYLLIDKWLGENWPIWPPISASTRCATPDERAHLDERNPPNKNSVVSSNKQFFKNIAVLDVRLLFLVSRCGRFVAQSVSRFSHAAAVQSGFGAIGSGGKRGDRVEPAFLDARDSGPRIPVTINVNIRRVLKALRSMPVAIYYE